MNKSHCHARIRMMNTDNLGVSGAGVSVTNDHYGHHHLTHPHLLPPHHSQHPSSIYCASANPYSELFSPFQTDFVNAHESINNNGISNDYLNLPNSIDYMVSHHQHSHHHHHAVSSLSQQQTHQQQQHHHHQQLTSSSNNDRTSSSVASGIANSSTSPSHSFPNNNNYSSSTEYYNPSVLSSKSASNNTNLSGTSSTNNNNSNNNKSSSSTSANTRSPYDSASTPTTSSPSQSTSYHSTTVKQETLLPGSFPIDSHSNYGNLNGHASTSTGNPGGPTNPANYGLAMDEYGSSLYHSPSTNSYPSYSTSGLLQATYSVNPYNVTHPDHMRLYSSQLKHDFGIDMRIKLLGGNQRTSPNTEVSPSQLCAVCQDTAQCQHYGVRTCEGCKGFFKRTVQKNAKYVCLADKNCPVDKRRRNRCQYCRFQTCLAVGMDKEVVRTDALKGRRGRLPSKPKSPSTRQPNSFQTQFCRFFNDSTPNPASLDFSKLNYRTVTNKESLCEEKLIVYDALTRSCDIIKQWADKFCLFYSIQSNERDRLFSNCLLEQIVFRTAVRLDGDRIVFCSGAVIHKVQFNCLFVDVAQQIYEFSSSLRAFKIDSIITATLASILLLDSNNTDYVYHRTPFSSTVTELHQKMVDSLKEYFKQQHEDGAIYLQLIERLNDVRRIALNLRKRLSHYRHSNGLSNSMNTLLDFVMECKPISNELHTNDENPSLSYMQYDL